MLYLTLRSIHVIAALLSICGFVARGVGTFSKAAWVRHRLARVLPHVIDTVLLLAAIGMLLSLQLSPWGVPWLVAKILGLLAYILVGVVALRFARREAPRDRLIGAVAFIAAIAIFAYIVSVAVTKNPHGLLALLHA